MEEKNKNRELPDGVLEQVNGGNKDCYNKDLAYIKRCYEEFTAAWAKAPGDTCSSERYATYMKGYLKNNFEAGFLTKSEYDDLLSKVNGFSAEWNK